MTGKTKILLPDTNIIIRYLLNDDKQLSKKACEIFLSIEEGNRQAIILESVFTKCIFILSKVYLVPRMEITTKLSTILQYKGIINIDKKMLQNALAIFSSSDLHIVDCILQSKSINEEYELIAFDKQLTNMFNDKSLN